MEDLERSAAKGKESDNSNSISRKLKHKSVLYVEWEEEMYSRKKKIKEVLPK